jgi:hypothetical protein
VIWILKSVTVWAASYIFFNQMSTYWSSRRLTETVALIWVKFQEEQERKAAALGGFFLWHDDSTYGFAIPLADDPDTSEVTHDAERTHS